MRKTRAFTLLELVVVIIVIGLLVALFSYLITPRGYPASKKSICKNNLKNIGLMCKMYAMDYNDSWPFESQKGSKARQNLYLLFDPKVVAMDPKLFGDVKVLDAFLCPTSGGTMKRFDASIIPGDFTEADYAYYDGDAFAMNDSKLSTKVVSGDAWDGHSNPSDGKWSHPGGTNTLSGDGHVEWRQDEYVGITPNSSWPDVK